MTSPALASVDDPDKVRALRRMKVIALSLLIVAAIVCLYAWHMVESGGAPVWGSVPESAWRPRPAVAGPWWRGHRPGWPR